MKDVLNIDLPDLPEVADGQMAFILEKDEYPEEPAKLEEFIVRMRESGRKVGYMPHHEINGSTTYRARLFVGPLPERILDFVGPTRDASMVAGFLAYRGILAENCYTGVDPGPAEGRALDALHDLMDRTRQPGRPPHLLFNEALYLLTTGKVSGHSAADALDKYLETDDYGDCRAMALTLRGDQLRGDAPVVNKKRLNQREKRAESDSRPVL